MAFSSSVVWEYRSASGSNTNGGAFNAAASGTDYSNQDSAQSTRTDIVIDGATNTNITSAADAFASDDVGNVINITSGTGFTVQRVEIISVAAGVATCDKSVGTLGSTGGNGTLGGALAVWTDALLELREKGNTVYVKNDGTMTVTAHIQLTGGGSETEPTFFEGYNTTRGDNPTGANRPTITPGSNYILLQSQNHKLKNIIFTGTNSNGFRMGGTITNSKLTNTSGSINRAALVYYGSCIASYCEVISTNGDALILNGTGKHVSHCYIHDSNVGVAGSSYQSVVGCVFDTCTIGIELGDFMVCIGNTFYNCTDGLKTTNASRCTIVNNIFDACTRGANWTSTFVKDHHTDYNVWDNTTDVTNFSKGDHDITGDPSLTDPANGDFTLATGSNAEDTGLDVDKVINP